MARRVRGRGVGGRVVGMGLVAILNVASWVRHFTMVGRFMLIVHMRHRCILHVCRVSRHGHQNITTGIVVWASLLPLVLLKHVVLSTATREIAEILLLLNPPRLLLPTCVSRVSKSSDDTAEGTNRSVVNERTQETRKRQEQDNQHP